MKFIIKLIVKFIKFFLHPNSLHMETKILISGVQRICSQLQWNGLNGGLYSPISPPTTNATQEARKEARNAAQEAIPERKSI